MSRAIRMARVRRWSLLRVAAPVVSGSEVNPAFRCHWSAGRVGISRARDVAAGHFTFLGIRRSDPSWHQRDVPQLWRFHLHYFDYASSLCALDPEAAFAVFCRLVESWVENNRVLVGDGWHPYTVSLRIVNWCEAGAYFGSRMATHPEFAARFHASLFGQARFLAANLETDVGGNHLLKNLRGLVWASAYFAGAEPARWRVKALMHLREQIREQVLPDGGHFERAPAYHVQVLDDLRRLRDLLREEGTSYTWLNDAVERMTSFLRAVLPPNGRLPLLKDTTLEADVSAFVSPGQPSRFLASSGYAVVRDDVRGEFLIADFGVPCPDHLPAHAHADLFSFELTDANGPCVVDSGVFEYSAGEWRNYFRSTAAHNTVEVAGCDQSEMWGSFRVARRARPREVTWRDEGGTIIMQGQHDGYRRLSPAVVHRRTIVAWRGSWLVVDELFGEGTTSAASRIHLHPARRVGDLGLATFGGEIRLEHGWYSEQFGEKQVNDVAVLAVAGDMPLRFGYAIAPGERFELTSTIRDGVATVVVSGTTSFAVALPLEGPPRIVNSL